MRQTQITAVFKHNVLLVEPQEEEESRSDREHRVSNPELRPEPPAGVHQRSPALRPACLCAAIALGRPGLHRARTSILCRPGGVRLRL